ncbi:hypothetical protein V9L05_05605 [Bernardetia sp. Wsw4-3y2]|uniref:GbsR/MarR family transcriptional regulator n=1 Tax=Bernardetia sp. Wsw4-3y2 TaxID=3127471 RepID=UPI0030D24597
MKSNNQDKNEIEQESVKTQKLQQKETMVEEMGVVFENLGLTPMHGRVFAFLLLSEPPYQDFYAIQEFLKASKSAISTALKFLTDRKMVQYITFSGDRKRYFQVNVEGWLENTKERLQYVSTLKELHQKVLRNRSDDRYVEFNEKLAEIIDFHSQLNKHLQEFVIEWEKNRK